MSEGKFRHRTSEGKFRLLATFIFYLHGGWINAHSQQWAGGRSGNQN
jgi:hypothetical protein